MELIAYIYDKVGTVITQVFDINDLQISKKLNNIGDAKFTIFYDNPGAVSAYWQEFNRIKIVDKQVGAEPTVFEGVIRGVETDLQKATIICNDYGYLFKKRLILTSPPTGYTGQIDTLLAGILANINATEATGFTLDCDVVASVSGKTYQLGTSFYDVLTDLSGAGYERKIENGVITFKSTIGIDRSIAGPDYLEFTYSSTDHDSDTIGKATGKYDGDNLNTVVLETSSSTVVTDPTGITTYGRIEGTFSNSDATNVNGYLTNRKESVKEFSVTPITNDYFLANIGDVVAVSIDTGSDMMFYEGYMKIIGKKVSGEDLEKVDYEFSKSKAFTMSIADRLRNMEERIRLLEI